jgi:hypothetical protein
MDTKVFTAQAAVETNGKDEGRVLAAFSVFGSTDTDGDIVEPSFFTDGQEVPMAARGHKWGDLNPGKGVIRVERDRAVFDGRFYLDTESGREHFRTVKNNGPLQEWSFCFRVLEAADDVMEGRQIRRLVKGEVFEVSPVLVGANRETQTLAIKGKTGLRLPDQAKAILGSVVDFRDHLWEHTDMRSKQGRELSDPTRELIKSYVLRLRGELDQIDMLLKSEPPAKEAIRLLAEFEVLRARQLQEV